MKITTLFSIAVFIISTLFLFGFTGNGEKKKLSKTLINDDFGFIAINQIFMWVSNNGDGSHDPRTNGPGFYWPGGENATVTAIFEDGLVWGGKVNDSVRVGGNTYRIGLQAGKILVDGTADDPSLERYKVWKIRLGWENLPPGDERESLEYDYLNWPVEDGAPWIDIDGDGIYTQGIDKPHFKGDEVLWYVSNDMDTSRTTHLYGSLPMGLEIQTTVYGFDAVNYIKNAVFKKYLIINKGKHTIDSMYFTYWSDDDLGMALDDFVGCDSTLNLGYTYNADNNDEDFYGSRPPAVGHLLLQGPIVSGAPKDSARFNGEWLQGHKNLPITSFAFYVINSNFYRDPQLGNYQGTLEMYNNMKGLNSDGENYIDPHTGTPTSFPLSGNPAGAGWYEGNGWPNGPASGDRKNLISSGPFTLASGDTQEVIIAILIQRGNSNLNSVTLLKSLAQQLLEDYGIVTSVNNSDKDLFKISEYSLSQNYPNPFNPTTVIEYEIPLNPPLIKGESTAGGFITLKVYDILGREVITLVNEEQKPGKYKVEFDASRLASGVYFYRLSATGGAGEFIRTKKMVLLK